MEDKIKQEIIIEETCYKEIVKTFSQAKTYSIIYFMWLVFSTLRYFIKYVKYDAVIELNFNSIFSFFMLPTFMVLELIIGSLAIYFYYKAFFIQKESIEFSDNGKFATSYIYFRKANRMSLLNIILLIISVGIYTYIDSSI